MEKVLAKQKGVIDSTLKELNKSWGSESGDEETTTILSIEEEEIKQGEAEATETEMEESEDEMMDNTLIPCNLTMEFEIEQEPEESKRMEKEKNIGNKSHKTPNPPSTPPPATAIRK